MPHTMTILSRKGGVGRTTLTTCLAGHYAKEGVRVLCIDLDGQGSLSRTLLSNGIVEQLRPGDTVAGLFLGDAGEPIHATDYENLFVCPAGDSLEPYANPDRRDFGRDQDVLLRFIHQVQNDFDLVLIDTPPNTNVSTVWAALVASGYVFSPVPANAFGVQSIASILNLVGQVQQSSNPNLMMLGYVISMLQRNSVHNSYRDILRKLHGSQVFDTEIPHATAFEQAMTAGKPLSHYKPKVKAAKVIGELADELSTRAEQSSLRGEAA